MRPNALWAGLRQVGVVSGLVAVSGPVEQGVPAGRVGLAMLLLRFWHRLGRREANRASGPDASRGVIHDRAK